MVIKYSLSDFDDEQLFSMCGITFTFIQDDGLRFKGTLDHCNTHRRPPRVLIDGDIRLPISLFKYIESEVDLFLMFKNDTPSQINESLKLNWHNAKKELPTNKVDDDGLPVMCLVVSFHEGKPYFYKDWINRHTKKWVNTNHDDVKYWIYLSEIPLPEE